MFRLVVWLVESTPLHVYCTFMSASNVNCVVQRTSTFVRKQGHDDPSESLRKCTNTACSTVVSHISTFVRSISATSCFRRSRARSRIACLLSVPLDVGTPLGVDRLDMDGVEEATLLSSARVFPFCTAVTRGGSEDSVGEDNARASTGKRTSFSTGWWVGGSKSMLYKNDFA